MNKIKVKINFENRSCSVSGVELTNGDYNSTKIEFEFDRTDGTKVFEMKKANGELVFSDEIINNEIVLVRYDEDNNPCSVFDEEGQYVFEVNLYSGDSKLTSDFGVIYVAKEQVQIGDEIAEAYLPIFDRMIQELEVAIDETNNLDIDATGTTVIITRKDGTTKEVETKGDTGETGQPGFSPTATVTKSGKTSVITITDVNGTTTTNVHDGENGQNGQDGSNGTNGVDGISPTATVSKVGKVATVTITDKNGTTTTTINDGQNGSNGVNGQDGYTPVKGVDYFDGSDGANGTNGQDGLSAYASAVLGGYTGTEQDFYSDLSYIQNIQSSLEVI